MVRADDERHHATPPMAVIATTIAIHIVGTRYLAGNGHAFGRHSAHRVSATIAGIC
jgi:hypothetical protein